MFSVALPVFDIVTVLVELLPTLTLPKATGDGLIVIVACVATPVPVILIVKGEGVPLVVSFTDPLTAPDVVGAKTAWNVRLAPAAIVDVVVRPLMVMPVPLTWMLEKVSVAFPLFCSVTGCELLLPTVTLEKLTLVGEAAICDCNPVPVNAS